MSPEFLQVDQQANRREPWSFQDEFHGLLWAENWQQGVHSLVFWPLLATPTHVAVTGDRLRPLQKVSVLHTLPKKLVFL